MKAPLEHVSIQNPFPVLCQKPLAFKFLVFLVKICCFQNNQKKKKHLVAFTALIIPNLSDKEPLQFCIQLGMVGIELKEANRLIFCPLKTNLNDIGFIVWSHL